MDEFEFDDDDDKGVVKCNVPEMKSPLPVKSYGISNKNKRVKRYRLNSDFSTLMNRGKGKSISKSRQGVGLEFEDGTDYSYDEDDSKSKGGNRGYSVTMDINQDSAGETNTASNHLGDKFASDDERSLKVSSSKENWKRRKELERNVKEKQRHRLNKEDSIDVAKKENTSTPLWYEQKGTPKKLKSSSTIDSLPSTNASTCTSTSSTSISTKDHFSSSSRDSTPVSGNGSSTRIINGNGTNTSAKQKKRYRLNSKLGRQSKISFADHNATLVEDSDTHLETINETKANAPAVKISPNGMEDSNDNADKVQVTSTNVDKVTTSVEPAKNDEKMKLPTKSSVALPTRRRKRRYPAAKKECIQDGDFSSSFEEDSSFLLSQTPPSKANRNRVLDPSKKMEDDSEELMKVDDNNRIEGTGISLDTPPGSPSSEVKRYNLKMMEDVQSLKIIRKKDASDTSVPGPSTIIFQKKSQSFDDDSVSSRASKISLRNRRIASDRFKGAYGSQDTDNMSQQSSHTNSRFKGAYGSQDTDNMSQQSSHANSSIQSEPIFTGAGTDIYAVQDAGSHQIFLDDCNYFCSSFFTGFVTKDEQSGEGGTKQHTSISADASCDLVVLLSSKKARGFLSNTNAECRRATVSLNTTAFPENDMTESIFKIFNFIPRSIRSAYIPTSTIRIDDVEGNGRDDFIDWNEIVCEEEVNDSPPNKEDVSKTSRYSLGSSRSRCGRKTDSTVNKSCGVGSIYDKVVAHALATLAYYLSIDCTGSKIWSASTSTTAARTFRRRVLRNKIMMLGISKLILADSIVVAILENENPETKLDTGYSIERECVAETESMDRSGHDPTKRGRRKKRRRKNGSACTIHDSTVHSVLSVPEDEMIPIECGLTLPTDKDNFDNRNESSMKGKRDFDFVSDEASFSGNSYKSTCSGLGPREPWIPQRFKRKIDTAHSKVFRTKPVDNRTSRACSECMCCAGLNSFVTRKQSNPGYLALEALNKISSGKHDDDDDDILEEAEADIDDDISENTTKESIIGDDIEISNLSNPMIFKNVMIRQSGAIPYLARALVETLEAANIVVIPTHRDKAKCCDTCIEYLRDRILNFSSLIDGLCLMSAENRKLFCHVAVKDNHVYQPILIPALLKTFSLLCHSSLNRQHTYSLDIGLAALRTLTSLTHENDAASPQFLARYTIQVPGIVLNNVHGVEVIFQLLHRFVNVNEKGTSQHIYDSIILCLNTLTNIVLDSSSFFAMCSSILEIQLKIDGESRPISALMWLARFIVHQTEPFRDVVVSREFGKTGENSGRDLESHEDEFLVTSGNGFIFLSCLLSSGVDAGSANNEIATKIKDAIISELPENANGDKVILVINTLKAFCNFYRYSIGELSVAIVTPVLQLIAGLEKLRS